MWEQSQYVFAILDRRSVINQIPQNVSDIAFCSTNQYFMVKKFLQPIYGQTLDQKQTKASLKSRADSRADRIPARGLQARDGKREKERDQ